MYGLALITAVLLFSLLNAFRDATRGAEAALSVVPIGPRLSASNEITLEDVVKAVNANPLPLEDKKRTIRISSRLFDGYNPNIFIYRRFLDEQPVDDLLKLDRSVHKLSNFQFYSEMRRIFSRVNDGHTRFLAPEPLRSAQATLGFQIAPYYGPTHNEMRFVVTEILDENPVQSDAIKPGVEIVEMNGVPIQDAIAAIGKRTELSNENTQLRGGARIIFNRALVVHPAPARTDAVIGYIDASKNRQDVTLPWMFEMDDSDPELMTSPEEESEEEAAHCSRVAAQASPEDDLVASPEGGEVVEMSDSPRATLEAIASARNLAMAIRYTGPKNNLFERYHRQAARQRDSKEMEFMIPSKEVPVPECLQDFFSAKTVDTTSGTFGYLTIANFMTPVGDATYTNLLGVVQEFPTNGLIVDIRGNPGGIIVNTKLLTEFLTNATINAMPFVARASHLTRKIVNSKNASEAGGARALDLKAAVETGVELGTKLTGPIRDLLWPLDGIQQRAVPQEYFGPVVVVTDALSFSAADIYVALQRDTGAAWVVGVDDSTGGAGASTVPYAFLQEAFPDVFRESLPQGMRLNTADVQFYRTGPKSGALIENIGVEPDERYFITRRDALYGDVDLIEHLGRILLGRR